MKFRTKPYREVVVVIRWVCLVRNRVKSRTSFITGVCYNIYWYTYRAREKERESVCVYVVIVLVIIFFCMERERPKWKGGESVVRLLSGNQGGLRWDENPRVEMETGGLLVLHVSIITVTFCIEKAGLYFISFA